MSKQAALAFRDRVNASNELQFVIRSALWQGQTVDPVALGREAGFEFTRSELDEVWQSIRTDGELSDFELEIISAGVCVK